MDCADVAVAADPVVAGRVEIGCHGAPPGRAGTPELTHWPGQMTCSRASARRYAPRTTGILPKPENLEQLPAFASRPESTRRRPEPVQDRTGRAPMISPVPGPRRPRLVRPTGHLRRRSRAPGNPGARRSSPDSSPESDPRDAPADRKPDGWTLPPVITGLRKSVAPQNSRRIAHASSGACWHTTEAEAGAPGDAGRRIQPPQG